MECQKCQTENPEENKFCRKCGEKLAKICSQCEAEVLSDDSFCGKCGQKLSESVETRGKVPAVDSERKHVTILFSDLSGYTAMTEKLDPEEVKDIMSRIFGDIAQVVAKYEGFIERFVGDAVMALFGVPKIHEDDAVRAIRAAREIHALVEAASPGLEKKVGHRLSMHSGINTGLVVTGEVNLEKGTHGNTGDAINMASRLEGLARSGEVLVGHETYRQAEGYFIFERLEPVKVKGKEEPVIAYRVIAPSTRRTRFEVSAQRGLTPLIGRERELEQLLDGFRRAKTGSGQAVSIVSEAGVGKSRLLYEFRKAVVKEEVTFLEGRCLSYGLGVAYHPVIDILKSTFDIMEGDGDQEITEKVTGSLKVLGADEASTLPCLLELLSVKDSSINKLPMSPEAKKDKILQALKLIALKCSEIRPLIITLEDLHWIDKSSEDAIKKLLDGISGARVFLLFTYRPEFVSSWDLKSYHSQVNLNRLSERQALAMVDHLLGSEGIDIDLEQLLLEKTERVPLFLEEFIRSFIDLKLIEKKDKYYLAKGLKEVSIPSTIQDVIMARVDSLSEGAKEVLQTGSVIRREFGYELLHKVTGFSEQALFSHLTALRDSELVYERGIFPQSTYIFKHALTQDVVYESILNKRKKKFHEEIGNALEDLYRENIKEHYGVLAEHFIESERYEKGAEYSKLAGDKALRSCAHSDAIEYAKKRVQCVERLPITESTQRSRIDARRTLAAYYQNLSRFFDAYEAVAPIVDLAEKLNNQKSLPAIYTSIGLYNLNVEEDHSKGCQYLTKVLDSPVNPRNYFSLWMANHNLGWYFSWNCEFERGLAHFEKCMDLTTVANDLVAMSWTKGTIAALVYCFQGKLDHAHPIIEESMRLSEKCGDTSAEVVPHVSHGLFCHLKGRFEEAENSLIKGLAICEKRAVVAMWAWSSGLLGDFYSDLGEHEKARRYYKRGIDIIQSTTFWPTWINMWEISIERLKVLDSNHDIDLDILFRKYENNKLKFCDGRNAKNIGDILLNIGGSHMSPAENWIKKAIEGDKRNGLLWQLARDYVVYSELFKRKGDQSEAKENLRKAINIFKECGADGWVDKYEKELTSLS